MCGTFYTFAMINIWNISIKSLVFEGLKLENIIFKNCSS